jgi:hypothetical protein
MLYAFPDSFDSEASFGNDPVREYPSALRGETKVDLHAASGGQDSEWLERSGYRARQGKSLLAVNLPQ